MTYRPVVLSCFDYTGVAVRDWARAGYECWCFDIQHEGVRKESVGEGWIVYAHADLSYDSGHWGSIRERFTGRDVAFVFGFPPCTDLANSGAKHWKAKAAADPLFQTKAVMMAVRCAETADALRSPYMVENPRGRLCTLWRKPDYSFDPCDFGGYLPEDDAHPLWPEIIPARDAYTKLTCLWTGNGFLMPDKRPVEPITVTLTRKDGRKTAGSPMWAKLGGKSLRTKNIRSATPRGFARAVFEANVRAQGIDPAAAADLHAEAHSS